MRKRESPSIGKCLAHQGLCRLARPGGRRNAIRELQRGLEWQLKGRHKDAPAIRGEREKKDRAGPFLSPNSSIDGHARVLKGNEGGVEPPDSGRKEGGKRSREREKVGEGGGRNREGEKGVFPKTEEKRRSKADLKHRKGKKREHKHD